MNDKDMDKFYNEFYRLRQKGFGGPANSSRLPIKYEGQKLRPNQKCPCGSKKKYKKCCCQRLESIAKSKGSNVISLNEVAQR